MFTARSSRVLIRLVVAAIAVLWAAALPSSAAEIQVFTSGAPSAVQKRLAPVFEKATGHTVVITAATLNEIRKRLEGDAKPDVVVLPRAALMPFEKAGALRPGTLIDVARVGIGVVVREGAPVPDVSTVDALRKTLLSAKSIAHPDPKGGGFTGAYIDRMFERLGIADAVRPKVTLGYAFTGGVANIAKGAAELGLFNISEIVPIKGVTLAGPLPAELQNYLVFSAAVHARAGSPEAATAYVRSLMAAEAQGAWKAGGMESIAAPVVTASASELTILSPGATEGVLKELLPQFEKASGHRVSITYGPAGNIANRVRKGEAVDILISSEPEAERLRKEGKTVDGSQTIVGRVGIGVFVRKGDPKPDISTAEAFERALATAKVIAYADPKLGGSASILVADIMRKLDVTGSIGARTRLVPPAKPLVDLVAAGGVDFGFQPVAQIFLDPRIEYVGPIPAPYQQYTNYIASQVATSKKSEAYKALMTFLDTPAAAKVWRSQGFEPR